MFSSSMPSGPLPATLAGAGAFLVITAAAIQRHRQRPTGPRGTPASGVRVPRDVSSNRNFQWHTVLVTQPVDEVPGSRVAVAEATIMNNSPADNAAGFAQVTADAVCTAHSAMMDSIDQGVEESMKSGVGAMTSAWKWATDFAGNMDIDNAVMSSFMATDKAVSAVDSNVAVLSQLKDFPAEISSKIVTPIAQVSGAVVGAAGQTRDLVGGVAAQKIDPAEALWSGAQQCSRATADIVDATLRFAESEELRQGVRQLQEAAPGLPAKMKEHLIDKRVQAAEEASQKFGAQAMSAFMSMADKAKEVAGSVFKTSQGASATAQANLALVEHSTASAVSEFRAVAYEAAGAASLALSKAPEAARSMAQDMALKSTALHAQVTAEMANHSAKAKSEAARAQSEAQEFIQGRAAYVSAATSGQVGLATGYMHASAQKTNDALVEAQTKVVQAVGPTAKNQIVLAGQTASIVSSQVQLIAQPVTQFSHGVAAQMGQAVEGASNAAKSTIEAAHAAAHTGFEAPITVHEETRMQAQQRADMKARRWEEVSKFMVEMRKQQKEMKDAQTDEEQPWIMGSERDRVAAAAAAAGRAAPPRPPRLSPHPAFAGGSYL